MGNTRKRAQKARQRLKDSFRRICPEVRQTIKKPEPTSTHPQGFTQPVQPDVKQGLTINVTVRFEAPLQEVMNLSYNVTENFETDDEHVGALVRRIRHCTEEMITRPDSDADKALRHTNPRVKPARYHVLYQVQNDSEAVWDRYYTSYQHTAVTRDGASDIMLEVDRIIGMFLLHHDPGFVWRVPNLGLGHPHGHKTTAPEVGKPQETNCVPTLDEPGYSIDVVMRTRTNGRDMLRMFELSSVIRNAVEKREEEFWEVHTACDGLEGRYGCRHVEEGAFELIVKVRNNLGPDYSHLAHRVHSHRHLVVPQDSFLFLDYIQEQVEMVRGHFDDLANATDDLVVTVHDLRSHNWMINDPLKVTVDGSACRDRITTEKILQRLQTGMFDVLKGHGTAAFVTAHKRGHLVMETTICRGEDIAFWDLGLFDNLHLKKRVLQERLRKRITQDLAKVCRDTIRLDPVDGMTGIEVLVPRAVDVTALSREAKTRLDNIQHASMSPGESVTRPQSRRESTELVGAAGETSGSSVPRCTEFVPGTNFEEKGTLKGEKRPVTPAPGSYRGRSDDRAFTPPSPSLGKRNKAVLRTPSQPHSVCEASDDGARTPPTPEGGFESVFKQKWAGVDGGAHTSHSPEGASPMFAEDTLPIEDEDDGARTPPSPAGSYPGLTDKDLYCIEEEEEISEGHSQQTIVYTPQRPSKKATSLLAAMTPDNLRASDIPNFTATRVWAGEEAKYTLHDDDLERTVTLRTFRRAESSRRDDKGAQQETGDQDSDDSLRTALFSSSIYQPMDLAGIAEPTHGKVGRESEGGETIETQEVVGNHAISNKAGKAAVESAQLGVSLDEQGVYYPDNIPTQAEDPQDCRIPSGETNTGSNGQSEKTRDPEITEGLHEDSMTPRSSLSSHAIGVFPRRRSEQNPIVPQGRVTLGSAHRRHVTCPTTQYIGLHSDIMGIEPREVILPAYLRDFRRQQHGSSSTNPQHDST